MNYVFERTQDAKPTKSFEGFYRSLALSKSVARDFRLSRQSTIQSETTNGIVFIQCPVCGSIHKENRKSQEEFECTECNHKSNADLNASINLRNRFVSDVLKQLLHNQDEFGRLMPKKLKKEKIKEILLENV